MKNLKISIELEVKGDLDDRETLKDEVYNKLQELMEEGDLEFLVNDEDEDSEEEDF